MESGKPSKEQLDSYFKTSRKYFDELAKQYYTNDREYYDKYFAPYYNNPFTRPRDSGSVKVFIYIMAIVMFSMVILVGTVLYYKGITLGDVFLFEDEPDETEVMYETVTTTERKITPGTDAKFDTLVVSYMKTDLEKGTYFYGMKNYPQAEYYLIKISKDDKDYESARQLLELIKNNTSTRESRKKAIQKIN